MNGPAPRRLKITGGTRPYDVVVRDAESGAIIENVTGVSWTFIAAEMARAGGGVRCVIEVMDVEIDVAVDSPHYLWVRPDA